MSDASASTASVALSAAETPLIPPDVQPPAGAVVDGLVFLGQSHFGSSLDSTGALTGLNAVGAGFAIAVPAHPHHRSFVEANDEVLAAAGSADGRLVALARVDPWDGIEALAELQRAVAAGARGLFLHPSEEHFHVNDQRLVRPLLEEAASLAVPVMLAAGFHLYAEPLQLGAAAAWTPDNPVVLTNGGQFNISGMMNFDAELALRNPNVYVQTTAMYREDFLERVVAVFGAEHLIYASGAPAFQMSYERVRVDRAHFSVEQRELILGGNSARIFGIERS
jgi:predicted TIM-barrel fold metal-dependent hydrolase